MQNKYFFLLCFIFFNTFLKAQNIDKIINAAEVEKIETILSSDNMKGRKTFSKEIDSAANFISNEFAKNKLSYYENNTSFFQNFSMINTMPISVKGLLDKDSLTQENVVAISTLDKIEINSFNNSEIIIIKKEDDFGKKLSPVFDANKNFVVLIDSAHIRKFKSMQRYANNAKFKSKYWQILILTSNTNPSTITINIKNNITEQQLKNVVSVLPGKTKKNDIVIFSAHYDHLGIGKPNAANDSIYNGSNDDAAGTTAVIMLSKYFSLLNKNERTIIFTTFTAEEIGGFGSKYFSKQLNADNVVAMFNIEMIGTESKWGKNSAYITGYEKSDMGEIMQRNLIGTKFHFEPDPYPTENLFYRSDNATLAALGVPAHTISTSKMDNEKYYHTVDDEIGTLDMKNMAEIIKAIAISSKSIINGKDTPTRVEKK